MDDVFSIPLERFLSDFGHHTQEWQTTSPYKVLIHFFQDSIQDKLHTTWGLTANMAIELAVVLFNKLPTFTYQIVNDITLEDPYHNQKIFLELAMKNYSKL